MQELLASLGPQIDEAARDVSRMMALIEEVSLMAFICFMVVIKWYLRCLRSSYFTVSYDRIHFLMLLASSVAGDIFKLPSIFYIFPYC